MAVCRTTPSSTTPRRSARPPFLPPYLNYFAGGPDSVRGYRESTLGPRDNIGIGNPFGGNLRVVSRWELLFPVPDKWKSAARVSWFYDMGNVFYTGNKVQFLGRGRHYAGQLPLQL